MRNFALVFFIIVAVAEICSHLIPGQLLHQICKPLLMPSLGLYYFLSVKWNSVTLLVLVALFLSFLGDSFLMYESIDQLYFMLGLGSFLVAHIFYTICYGQHEMYFENNQLANVRIVRMALPVLMAGTGLIFILYPVLGELRIPVIIYSVVLMIMVLKALMRYQKTSSRSFVMVAAGAILFMISDSMIAINKFLQPISYGSILIMVTYIVGQFLIIQGMIFHRIIPGEVRT